MLSDLIQFLPITLIAAALLFLVKVANRGDRVRLNIKKQELISELMATGLSEQQAKSAAEALASLVRKNANEAANSTNQSISGDINPATGLRMFAGVDTGGNLYGHSSHSEDYRHY